MIAGIESDEWYSSEAARTLRRHAEKKIDEHVAAMREGANRGAWNLVSQNEGAIQALEQLRRDLVPPAEVE